MAFAVVRQTLKEPPAMSLARAVPWTKVTSAGEIPGGNSSPE